MRVALPEVEPFHKKAKRLAKDKKKWSGERLSYEAADPDVDGLKMGTVRKAIDGNRYPTIPLMKAVADAIGVSANDFPEYRLARVRALFDERTLAGGLDEALANLSRYDAGLAAAADEAAVPAPLPASGQGRQTGPGLREAGQRSQGES